MKYYKVKKQIENIFVLKNTNVSILVKNELITPYEWKKLKLYNLPYSIFSKYIETVEINRKKIYWFFGCRHAD